MRVRVRIRDALVNVDVGPGHQRLKWLAMVALQRYAEMPSSDGTIGISHAHVATGLMDSEGNELPPNKSIRVALSDGDEVFAMEEVNHTGRPLFLMGIRKPHHAVCRLSSKPEFSPRWEPV